MTTKGDTSNKQKNSKVKQKAGALIGDGAFGCVYTPPLPCAKKQTKPASSSLSSRRDVTKVFNDTEEMQAEWQMSELISKVDPKQEYFIYATNQCDVKTSELEAQARTQPAGSKYTTCSAVDFLSMHDTTVPSLRMPYGGHPFHDWLVARKGKITVVELVRLLIPVFEGLKLFSKHGLVHQDIKANNILIDSHGKVRIIDFSFTVREADLLDVHINKKVASSYWVLPVECRIRKLLARRTLVTSITSGDIQRLVENEESLINHTFKSADYKSMKYIKRYFWATEEYEAHIKASVQRAMTQKTSLGAWGAYGNRVDIYGFGLILLWASQHTSTFANPTSAQKQSWTGFTALVRHMTCPDAKKRATATQALKMAKAFVSGQK